VKILIAEEALRSLRGHWFEYIRTIVEGCRRAGDDVTVACHREAIPEVVKGLDAVPIFVRSAWDPEYQQAGGGALRRLGRIFRHNAQLYRAARQLLRWRGPFGRVFVPTILIDHHIAWTLLAWTARRNYGKMVLLFVNGHGIYHGPGQPTTFPRSANTLLSRFLLRAVGPLLGSGRVILAAETSAMAAEFTRFCGLAFQCFPHPVELHDTLKVTSDVATAKKPGEIIMSSLGFARYEKGSDLLQAAILRLRQDRPDLANVRFVIQWLEDFAGPNGRRFTRDPALLADPRVEFLSTSFTPAEYWEQLARADGMILPYRANSYHARVSRLAIEAAMLGIPMVYTCDTWFEELVSKCGAGLPFQDENLDELTAAIIRLVDELPLWKAAARARAATARQLQSPARFRECLFGDNTVVKV
jgi:glycosyltransferase involved in cell wall biosynthesis